MAKNTMATIATMAMTMVVVCSTSGCTPSLAATRVVGPMISGIKPADSSWNSAGNGPTDLPARMASDRPLKISMPASVTMKLGIL
ncbi:hypothetical protein D3C72_1917030 [compost metagenome]